MWQDEVRVEELDSDDADTQGDSLNSGKRFASDPLHFTGIDLAPGNRARRGYAISEGDSTSDSEESENEYLDALQISLRDKEEALVQSALARMRRAQEKGKKEVKLNQDELDALEKRRKRMQAAAAAAAKLKKGSGSSGGSGSERKKRNGRNITALIAAFEDLTGRTRSKYLRNEGPPYPSETSNPSDMLVAGSDDLAYAPPGYYPVQSGSSRNSPSRSRSGSTQQLQGSQPPPFYSSSSSNRHFSGNMRPTSSSSTSSRRPLPDEAEWIPETSRRDSVSSQNYPVDPFEYQVPSKKPPPIPLHYMQQQGRRNVSGPADISYSSVRRNLPIGSNYPAAARGVSDPAPRRKSSYRDELGDNSSNTTEDESDDLGNGVQVFIEEKEDKHEKPKEKERAKVGRKPVGSSNGRKKGKGR